eukprot:3052573-Rhodomonas_salina.1
MGQPTRAGHGSAHQSRTWVSPELKWQRGIHVYRRRGGGREEREEERQRKSTKKMKREEEKGEGKTRGKEGE